MPPALDILLLVRRSAVAHIIADRDKIYRIFQNFLVLRSVFDPDIVFLKKVFHISRIFSSCVHVSEEQRFSIFPHCLQNIFRGAGERVDRAACDHTAHLIFRVGFMGQFCHKGAGNKLMMDCLIENPFVHLIRIPLYPAAIERRMEHHVNFIKCKPIFHPSLIPLEHGSCITLEEPDQSSVRPSAVLCGKVQGHLIVRQCDQRLDPVFLQFTDHIVIEFQSLFIGLCLVSIGKDPAGGGFYFSIFPVISISIRMSQESHPIRVCPSILDRMPTFPPQKGHIF